MPAATTTTTTTEGPPLSTTTTDTVSSPFPQRQCSKCDTAPAGPGGVLCPACVTRISSVSPWATTQEGAA